MMGNRDAINRTLGAGLLSSRESSDKYVDFIILQKRDLTTPTYGGVSPEHTHSLHSTAVFQVLPAWIYSVGMSEQLAKLETVEGR